MSKTKELLDAGFGNILSYVSGQASTVPVIDNAVKKDVASTGISVAQTAGSVAEMIGKTLPGITIGGKFIPAASLGLSGAGLLNDILAIDRQYNKDGTIPTSSVYSALSNISAGASALPPPRNISCFILESVTRWAKYMMAPRSGAGHGRDDRRTDYPRRGAAI